jgi:putative ABC transport system ATP-binding protein
MIKINELRKTYDKGIKKVEVLKGINLFIDRGDFVALMGPSGSGKSTLLNLIGGLDKASGGSIFVGEQDISTFDSQHLANFRRQKIGFVFQQFYLIPTLSVIENVMLALLPIKMSKETKYSIVRDVIKKVGLEDRGNHLPGELSGGEQQRIAISRALVNQPLIILADEPTGDLDSKTGETILDLLADLNKKENRTVIIATHDDKVAKITKRKIMLQDGQVVADTRI